MNSLCFALLSSGLIWHAQGVEEKPLKSLGELLFAQHPTAARVRNAGVAKRVREGTAMEDAFDVKTLPGVSAPVNKMWDPWGYTDAPKARIQYYQEAEIKHARLAMMGWLGMVVGAARSGNGMVWETAGKNMDSIGKFAAALALIEAYFVIKRVYRNPNEMAAAMNEGAPLNQWENAEPGDIGFDPLNIGPKDPAKMKEMKTKELNNGRLAMLATAGIWAQESFTGQPFAAAGWLGKSFQ